MPTPQPPQPPIDPLLLARTSRAIRTLATRKKAIIKEHSERTKRLLDAAAAIEAAQLTPTEDMIAMPFSLSPDLIALIENPEDGL